MSPPHPRVRLDLRDLANPAGLLTASRLPLAALFPLVVHDPAWAFGVYALAMFTDVIDGEVARRTGHTSQTGALLDGFVDKVFQVNAAWALAVADLVPAWWLLCWFSRELVQLVMVPWLWRTFLDGRARPHHATRSGKNLTMALAVTVAVVLAQPWWPAGLTVAAVVTPALGLWGLANGLAYIQRSWRLQPEARPAPPPPTAHPPFEAAADLR